MKLKKALSAVLFSVLILACPAANAAWEEKIAATARIICIKSLSLNSSSYNGQTMALASGDFVSGSGLIVDRRGVIITTRQVIEGCFGYPAVLMPGSGAVYVADILFKAEQGDVVALKIDVDNWEGAYDPRINPANLNQNENVWTLGFPFEAGMAQAGFTQATFVGYSGAYLGLAGGFNQGSNGAPAFNAQEQFAGLTVAAPTGSYLIPPYLVTDALNRIQQGDIDRSKSNFMSSGWQFAMAFMAPAVAAWGKAANPGDAAQFIDQSVSSIIPGANAFVNDRLYANWQYQCPKLPEVMLIVSAAAWNAGSIIGNAGSQLLSDSLQILNAAVKIKPEYKTQCAYAATMYKLMDEVKAGSNKNQTQQNNQQQNNNQSQNTQPKTTPKTTYSSSSSYSRPDQPDQIGLRFGFSRVGIDSAKWGMNMTLDFDIAMVDTLSFNIGGGFFYNLGDESFYTLEPKGGLKFQVKYLALLAVVGYSYVKGGEFNGSSPSTNHGLVTGGEINYYSDGYEGFTIGFQYFWHKFDPENFSVYGLTIGFGGEL